MGVVSRVTFQPYKSPGPDGVIPAMLQNASPRLLQALREIYRACLHFSFVPGLWREVTVAYIPKAGKPSHSAPKDYRPISLSSFLLKTLERLLDFEIRSELGTGRLSGAQHAYTKGKSVDTALHEVVGQIERNLKSSNFTLAAFLDIEGAFNNVKLVSIHDSLCRLGAPSILIDWVDEMLRSRVINSKIGGSSIRRSVTGGTPQGGVLSPLLWLLVIDEVLRDFDQLGIKVVAYADDVVLMVGGKFLPTLSELMQGALTRLSRWAHRNGLGVNPAKTELVLFTRKRRLDPFALPVLDGVTLRLSSEAKYLGVILDRQLRWKRNIEERTKRGLAALYSCRNSVGKNWGLRPRAVHWLYKAVVLPVLTYGGLVWWQALGTGSRLRMLSSVQRAASVLITGAVKSTPQPALNAMLGLRPLHLQVRFQAARSALRLREMGFWRGADYGHACVLHGIGERIGIGSRGGISDYLTPTLRFGFVDVVLPSRDDWDRANPPLEGIAFYTDGSKKEEGTGAGVYCGQLGLSLSYRLDSRCSVFQAEVFAIRKALELIRSMNEGGRGPVNVFIDSQAALKALKSFSVRSKVVLDCKLALEGLQRTVRLCWVPGHSGITGNEVADELARNGSESTDLRVEESVLPPLGHYVSELDGYFTRRAGQIWCNEPRCRVSRSIWPALSSGRTTSLLSTSKSELRLATGLITGHCSIRSLTCRWEGGSVDYCRLCGDEEELETVEHLLCQCPVLFSRRQRILGDRLFQSLASLSDAEPTALVRFAKCFRWLWRRGGPELG